MSCEKDTADLLRAAGQKVTPQRLLILSCLRHAGGHVTAGQLLEEARRSFPYIDASTVYRTLSSAKEIKLASETRLGSGDHLYEWLGSDRHHHLVCRSCGRMIVIEESHLDELAASLERDTGFHADLDHLAIFGLCADCQAKAAIG